VIEYDPLLIIYSSIDFRQCFQLFAPQGYVDTPDKLCFIMRSLSMAPTIAELKRYFSKYKKGIIDIIVELKMNENID
jgi:hypothetical protein